MAMRDWNQDGKAVQSGLQYDDGDVFDAELDTLQLERQRDGTYLTAQQKRLLAFMRQGLDTAIAANAAGMTPEDAFEFLNNNRDYSEQAAKSQQTLQQARVIVTRDMLTLMLLEERERSGTASEGISAIKEIGRLNGLYPEQAEAMRKVKDIEQGVTVDGVTNSNVLAGKSDDELMAIAGFRSIHNV